MGIVPVILFALGTIVFFMSLFFLLSRARGRNDVADIAWGLCFVLLAWMMFLFFSDALPRQAIVLFLVSLWGLRLSVRIFARNRHKPEDLRYTMMKQNWGHFEPLFSYLFVFLFQGVLVFLISTSFLWVLIANNQAYASLGLLDILGCTVWGLGFLFECIGDMQLDRFLRSPSRKQGDLLDSGLWRYTRHPNYFGEVTQWWGIWIVACSLPLGWITIVSPLVITILILKVSGVPMLEKIMEKNPRFLEYRESTSVFFPLPPRKKRRS